MKERFDRSKPHVNIGTIGSDLNETFRKFSRFVAQSGVSLSLNLAIEQFAESVGRKKEDVTMDLVKVCFIDDPMKDKIKGLEEQVEEFSRKADTITISLEINEFFESKRRAGLKRWQK